MWHHHHHHHTLPPELGMYVLTPTTSFHPQNPNSEPLISTDGEIPNLWQPQQVQGQTLRTINFDQNPLRSTGGGGSSFTCQDCGNQAKKDCSHGRCRTCCRSRGLDCTTHVKSTWVPAARRRERQMMAAGAGASSGSTSGAKKQRVSPNRATTNSHTSTSNTPPRSFDTSSSHQDANLKDTMPGQVRAPAVFKCVKVTAVEDGEDEFAYQAVVKIGGHIFKGFLYDQGTDPKDMPNLSDLHLGGGGRGSGRNAEGSSSPLMEPLEVYGVSGGGYLGGSTYGNTIN